jgi:hypothetical protein
MILAAAYLLYMFQRIAFGDVSDFLRGLGHHLTDMTPLEIMTLAPLGALVVAFGLFPGLLLDLFAGTVTTVLEDVGRGATGDIPAPVAAIALGVLVVAVGARVVFALASDPDRPSVVRPQAPPPATSPSVEGTAH